MLKVYFDNVLIDTESYTQLDNEYKLFLENFKLGSVACNSFKLSVLKSAVSDHPNEVKIEDDNTNWYFIVDNVVENDDVYVYNLVDKLMNFNFEYDASILINTKAELEEECYLSDIWKDMCDKANVEYDETYVFENDIIVNWYDNRIQARRYLSFIAELQSGYACILENGKQSFKKFKRASVKTIDADECSDLIVGEKKKITRVVYDGGTFKYEFGDETGDTLYIQNENVYIVNEQIVENIYNNIKDFEFYIIDVPNAPMDSSVRAGDIITFDDNGKLYPTIAQYSMSYAGGWTGGYKLKVNTNRQQETQITRTANKVRNLQTKVDRLNNEFGIIAEEIEKLTDYIRNVGTTGNYIKLPNTPKSFGAINKLSIKGFELMPLYPGMAYPSEYTYPGVLNFYTLIFDTVPTFDNNPNYVFVNSPLPLNKLGDVYDELLIEANKVKVIQRIGYDFDNEQWSVLSTPITHELNDVLLPTFEGDTYVSVKYFDNLIYNAEYLIKNDLTSNFATQLESSAQFKINQDELNLKASKKDTEAELKILSDKINLSVGKNDIISSINLSPEEIKIQAEKLKLEGLTTINNGFKVLLDGSIEAVNAKLTGDIFLPNGGRVIGGDGILGSMQFASFGQFDGFSWLGYSPDTYNPGYVYKKKDIPIVYSIPNNFTPIFAFVTIQHTPITWSDVDMSEKTGNSRNIRLYKANDNTASRYYMMYASGYEILTDNLSGTEIPSAFGASGFNGERTIGYVNTQVSSNIVNDITEKNGTLFLRTADSISQDNTYCIERTGMAKASLFLIGYTSVS